MKREVKRCPGGARTKCAAVSPGRLFHSALRGGVAPQKAQPGADDAKRRTTLPSPTEWAMYSAPIACSAKPRSKAVRKAASPKRARASARPRESTPADADASARSDTRELPRRDRGDAGAAGSGGPACRTPPPRGRHALRPELGQDRAGTRRQPGTEPTLRRSRAGKNSPWQALESDQRRDGADPERLGQRVHGAFAAGVPGQPCAMQQLDRLHGRLLGESLRSRSASAVDGRPICRRARSASLSTIATPSSDATRRAVPTDTPANAVTWPRCARRRLTSDDLLDPAGLPPPGDQNFRKTD